MWITPLDFRKVWISGARRKDGEKMYALTNLFFAAVLLVILLKILYCHVIMQDESIIYFNLMPIVH